MSKIRVLAKRPDSSWYCTNVENNLRNLQNFVGGYIETVTIAFDAVVICDEDGRLKGKEHCATVAGYDFVGDILIAGVDGDEFADVPVTLKQAREMGLCKEG